MSSYIKLSLQKYKYLQKIKKNSYYRRKEEKAIVQGQHEVLELLKNRPDIVDYLLFSDNFNIPTTYGKPAYTLDRWMAKDLSYDNNYIDVAAVVNTKNIEGLLTDFTRGFLIGLVNVQDPFNLGSIFRTAESLNVTGIILMDNCVDPFNPKVVASSTGSIFRVPFAKVENSLEFLNNHKQLTIVGTDKNAQSSYFDKKLSTGIILFGNEGKGLSEPVLNMTTYNVKIPIKKIDSLNLAVSVGIITAFHKLEK